MEVATVMAPSVLCLLQVNDMNEAALKDFSTRLATAAAAPPGSNGSKVELRSAVHDAKYAPFAAPVNGLSACPHHVSCNLLPSTVTSIVGA